MTQRLPLVVLGNGLTGQMPSIDELPNIALPTNPIMKGVQAMRPPVGTTAERNGAPTLGDFRYNSSLGIHEGLTPNGWIPMSAVIISSYRGNVAQTSGTTRIPFDNTPPLVTEGTQLWSKTVTPKVVGAIMTIEFDIMVDGSTGSQTTTLSLFRDNTLIGFTASASTGGTVTVTSNKPGNLALCVNDTVTSLTSVTYSCRIGNESAGTWYAGRAASASFGGTNSCGWKIDEVLP